MARKRHAACSSAKRISSILWHYRASRSTIGVVFFVGYGRTALAFSRQDGSCLVFLLVFGVSPPQTFSYEAFSAIQNPRMRCFVEKLALTASLPHESIDFQPSFPRSAFHAVCPLPSGRMSKVSSLLPFLSSLLYFTNATRCGRSADSTNETSCPQISSAGYETIHRLILSAHPPSALQLSHA